MRPCKEDISQAIEIILITKLFSIEGDLWSTPYMTARSFLDKRCPLGGTGYIVKKRRLD